jgi:hypothetical protein
VASLGKHNETLSKKKKMKKKKKNIMDGNWKFPSEFGESLDVNRVFTTYEIFK